MEETDQDIPLTPDDSPATARTLLRALIAYGGVTRLAKALGVSVDDLVRWMHGDSIAPHAVFLKSLELAFVEQLELAFVEQKAASLYDLSDQRRKRLKP